ncbi:carboxylate-amine ligase [Thioalkalivibrio sp. XN8]|uniref:carboxylate-amine ligase n=1 Tax=Thioalkalivibrio sp. XN8 TaxID=2712863 RepID=UPI0013ED3376|nr:carboxylate-amine ligase [Thioalkalivibrio sp. XN8]NGP53662.1 carboxylate-amine ligase [Thioalkalivibrio sp. XN8]
MSDTEPSFSIGVEEEYLLVDRETRNLVTDMPESMIEDCEHEMEAVGQVSPEFLRAQIEVGTKVCRNISEVREDLARMRDCVIRVADRHGCAPIAASTHPFAHWLDQRHTAKERYDNLGRELQATARRLLICGMHVHVGIEDEETRMDLMGQFAYFLPHLLALSCSSPFWEGQNTGLKSFRLTVFDALPRTGMPESFASWAEYERHVELMVHAGLIEDGTKIWWDVRPSARYPTLETRVMDVCTRIDDAVCIAAINVCLLRMLYRLRRSNQRWRTYARMLLMENRWRAMRYSFDEGLVDLGRGEIVPHAENLGDLIELIREDAEALGCTAEVEHAWKIMERGTSAHRQVAAYERALAGGASEHEALQAVVDLLIEETRV